MSDPIADASLTGSAALPEDEIENAATADDSFEDLGTTPTTDADNAPDEDGAAE